MRATIKLAVVSVKLGEDHKMETREKHLSYLLRTLTDVGVALSIEKNHSRLLELILVKAQEITHADGGTLYTCSENKELKFEIMLNKSMHLHFGGSRENPANFNNLELYNEQGEPNMHLLAPHAAITGKTINIKNTYRNKKFDLSGTKNFDKIMNYHSKMLLTVPMSNHLNEVIGVLQLVNSINPKTKKIIPFSKQDQYIIESLASQAAVIITNRSLIDAQKNLFDSLIKLIANAIDEKSPYTAGHCKRVPVITLMLAHAVSEINHGPLKEFHMTEDELYELEVAAWLHDCGKIATPEVIMDKATKLEGILDGINLIATRFEVIKRDAFIHYLQKKVKQLSENNIEWEQIRDLQKQNKAIDDDLEFIKKCNIGGEYMLPESLQRIAAISKQHWIGASGEKEPLLTDHEVQMLSIKRGTLSDKERKIINNHVNITLKMLQSLPYPKHLKNVPELAASHHERVDGKGYPRGLNKEQLPLPARMIAIADVFEALTAKDRPYKKSISLSDALEIMKHLKQEGHIDPDLFDIFLEKEIPERYFKMYLI